MTIIAVINQKGGVGKSTVACNLAGTYAHLGSSVRVFDANPKQASAYGWCQSRIDFEVPGSLTGVRVDGDFRKAVRADATNFDHIIIDTPPDLGQETAAAVAVASIVVVPLRIGQFDAWSFAQTVKLIEDGRAVGREIRALAFVNAVPHYIQSELDEASDEIKGWGSEVIEHGPTLIDRAAYRKGLKLGRSIPELQKEYFDRKAEDEWISLFERITGHA